MPSTGAIVGTEPQRPVSSRSFVCGLRRGHTELRNRSSLRMIGRLLRVSGWLELMLGTGHTVFGTLILTRPQSVAGLVARLGWPAGILSPIAAPEQYALVLALSLGAGIDWLVFGAMLL